MLSALLSSAARSYYRAVRSNPICTKCCSAASLAGCGDVFAQSCRKGDHAEADSSSIVPLDLQRTLAFVIFGGGYTGVFNHFWLGWLARRYSAPGLTSVLKKQAWQHGVLNPLFFVPCFYTVTETIRGRSMDDTAVLVRAKYWETLVAAWSVWGPATAVMFAIVPERYQVLYTAVLSFGWNVVLSYLSNKRVDLGDAADRGAVNQERGDSFKLANDLGLKGKG